ncbi:MAG TPA: T9SS type A sorting domain-containing protein [Gemmatimonadota bacterium]|nr:T9SS type A sorting domain-containing protein [Gemmatimonadota bacterium]
MPRLSAAILIGLLGATAPASGQKLQPAANSLVPHDVNRAFLRVSNRGGFGLALAAVDAGNFPRGTLNRFLFGSGLWIGGIGDVDANGVPDSIVTVGYNPSEPEEIEWVEGAVGGFDRNDPRFRVLDSTNPEDQDEFPATAVADQELFTVYDDRVSVVTGGIPSIPIGIEVRQRSFAFDEPGLDGAIVFQWDLLNISHLIRATGYTIRGLWTGIVLDPDITVARVRSVNDDTAAPLDVDGQPVLLLWDSDFSEQSFEGAPGFLAIVPLVNPGGRTTITQLASSAVPGVLPVPLGDGTRYATMAAVPPRTPTIVDPGFDLRALVAWGTVDLPEGEVHRTAAAFVWAEPSGTPPALLTPLDPDLDQDLPVLSGLVEAVRAVRTAYGERLASLPALLDFPGEPPPPGGGGDGSGALLQNFPNPFRETTTIIYEVVDGGDVEIVVYDLQGREVERLAEGFREPGEYTVEWDGRSAADREVAAGIYVIRMSTSTGMSTIRALKVP